MVLYFKLAYPLHTNGICITLLTVQTFHDFIVIHVFILHYDYAYKVAELI